jgi:hypothetical protein
MRNLEKKTQKMKMTFMVFLYLCPEKIANLLKPVQSPDMVQSIDAGTEAPMQTEYLA